MTVRYCGVCLAVRGSVGCCLFRGWQPRPVDLHRDCEHETELERWACESLMMQERLARQGGER